MASRSDLPVLRLSLDSYQVWLNPPVARHLFSIDARFYTVFRSRKLQSGVNSIWTSCVARNIVSALELGDQDSFISSDTTLNVLSVFNPRILKRFPHYYWVLVWKVQPPFLPIQVLAWFIDLNIPKCWCSRHPESQQHCLHVIKVAITCHFDQRVIGHSNTSRHIVVRLLSDRPTIINGFPKCSRRFFRESELFVGKPGGSIYLPRISKFTGFFMFTFFWWISTSVCINSVRFGSRPSFNIFAQVFRACAQKFVPKRIRHNRELLSALGTPLLFLCKSSRCIFTSSFLSFDLVFSSYSSIGNNAMQRVSLSCNSVFHTIETSEHVFSRSTSFLSRIDLTKRSVCISDETSVA